MKKKLIFIYFNPTQNWVVRIDQLLELLILMIKQSLLLISLTKCNYSKFLNKEINYIKLKSKEVFIQFFELRKKLIKL